MGKRTILFLIVALVALGLAPAIASADLVNDYGMHFAGQSKCLECHDEANAATVHGRMARTGLFPTDLPGGATSFRAPGNATQVLGTNGAKYDAGGEYAYSLPWVTLGDNTAGLGTEYLFWQGSTDPTIMPWNLVEGLGWTPENGWVQTDGGTKGLWDVPYGCQRCHQLGTTVNAKNGEIIANPAITAQPGPTTPVQWAAEDTPTRVDDFMTDPTASQPGMSIQCEACHGTGLLRSAANGDAFDARHWNSGTQISNRYVADDGTANTFANTLGNSQVCGQCHGSFTPLFDKEGKQITLGTATGGWAYGYTPNVPLRNFVNVNGVTTKVAASCSANPADCHSVTAADGTVITPGPAGVAQPITYTTIPSPEGFLAHPTWFWMFPNGSNAKGGHYYYDEWQASGHSWRGAITYDNPDASAYQKLNHSHYSSLSQSNIDSKCYRCHTGEGYLESKNVIGANSESGFLKDFSPTATNTGLMGQECTACHGGHPASLDEADVVREPDKAGERSAAGLSVDNQSICEDCHNWQKEVQGSAWTTTVKPLATLTARGGPSHPQRETLHGRIMLEIPAATGDFMPGAKCEDCHMPKTNKGANRISHGMKPMLPGEAETWNAKAGSAYMGEDSCSKCHGGEDQRDRLQTAIETWQEETTAAADAAAAAITAAQTRSEFSLTDPNNAGYILSGRATWNYKAWGADGSTGVHNPEYIIAGLEKAEQLAKSVGGSFAAVSGPASVLPGVNTFISGKVVNGDGSPAAGAVLKLWANGAVYGGSNPSVSTVSAADNGTFAFLVSQTDATDYQVQWLRSGDATTFLTSATVKVAKAKYASTTTIKKSASTIKLNKSVKISGAVTPAAVGATVKIQYRKGTSGSWKSTTRTLDASSNYSKKFTPGSKGTWYYKATFNGTTEIATSKTSTIHVHVK